MSIELRPLGELCNLGCTYCYQEPVRKAGNINTKYNIDKMLEEAEKTGQFFHLFGGEALLVPHDDLEKFWKRGLELHGHNGLQTNGTLIDDKHIELFKKYNVSVGVSIDGPNDLNNLREVRGRAGKEDKTLEATNKIIENIRKLVHAGVSVSIIITVHKLNGSSDKLPRLKQFIRWLGDMGVVTGNLHVLEVDKTMPDQEIHVLSQKENIVAMVELAEFFEQPENKDLRWRPFCDYKDALNLRDESAVCYLRRCDPLNTQAVYGIEGDGALSNCGRTNKEGIQWYKTEENGYERYISLYNTPAKYDGCQGCRYFMVCGGSCPGESADSDFRNKTIHCATQKALFGFFEKQIEKEGGVPLSKSPDRLDMEKLMIESLIQGYNPSFKYLKEMVDRKNKKIIQVQVKG